MNFAIEMYLAFSEQLSALSTTTKWHSVCGAPEIMSAWNSIFPCFPTFCTV